MAQNITPTPVNSSLSNQMDRLTASSVETAGTNEPLYFNIAEQFDDSLTAVDEDGAVVTTEEIKYLLLTWLAMGQSPNAPYLSTGERLILIDFQYQ